MCTTRPKLLTDRRLVCLWGCVLFRAHTKASVWRGWRMCGDANVFPSRPPQPHHGWSNEGEECGHVNSDNVELCPSRVGLLLSVRYIPWLLQKAPVLSRLRAGLDLFLRALFNSDMAEEQECTDMHYSVWHERAMISQNFTLKYGKEQFWHYKNDGQAFVVI